MTLYIAGHFISHYIGGHYRPPPLEHLTLVDNVEVHTKPYHWWYVRFPRTLVVDVEVPFTLDEEVASYIDSQCSNPLN